MKVLVFGDSIARGAFDLEAWWWVERLKTHYLATYEETGVGVYNFSVSGSDSRGVLQCLENDISKIWAIEPEAISVVIAIGTNDPCFIKDDITVPIDEFRINFQKIISLSLQHTVNIAVIWWFPLDERLSVPWKETIYSWRNQDLHLYNEVMKDMSKKNDVTFIDIRDTITYDDIGDGLHPNAVWHKKIYELMVQYVDAVLLW
jgi:lysophospholipase L1-like esterase